MYRVGIIGDKNSVMGFLPLGLLVEYADNVQEAYEKLKKLLGNNCVVIYITEKLYVDMDFSDYSESTECAIIPIPGNDGGNGAGINRLKKAVEKAVGADILFND